MPDWPGWAIFVVGFLTGWVCGGVAVMYDFFDFFD